jgi:hypothetical protein
MRRTVFSQEHGVVREYVQHTFLGESREDNGAIGIACGSERGEDADADAAN